MKKIKASDIFDTDYSNVKETFNNMHTIQTLLQEYVDDYVSNCNYDEACPPKYIVSIGKNALMITITHNDISFTERFFPEKEMTYGINLIKDRLDSLYSRTM